MRLSKGRDLKLVKRGLGKGLSALIEDQRPDMTAESEAQLVSIHEIIPNEKQPRKSFKDEGLQDLAVSIEQYGIIQPLVVKKAKGGYEIIAGERRWRAARLLGIEKVPIIIKDYTPQETLEVSLIENLQREDLNPMEEAAAYHRLIDEFQLTQEEISKRVGKSRPVIANALRLLKLDLRVQNMLTEEIITSGHARALLAISDLDLQYELAKKIFDEEMTVREIEKWIKDFLGKKDKSETKKKQESDLAPIYRDIEERFKQILGTKVQISRGKKKGKIEIEYYSDEDLERILSLVQSIQE
ncbi:MAG: ParB/RepB/Spo0J family partition protein [Epulopiscium sp.]|nr:ParB/RepB/Spo0J family partition protein [Candidatus Epulonipiscium sp.]